VWAALLSSLPISSFPSSGSWLPPASSLTVASSSSSSSSSSSASRFSGGMGDRVGVAPGSKDSQLVVKGRLSWAVTSLTCTHGPNTHVFSMRWRRDGWWLKLNNVAFHCSWYTSTPRYTRHHWEPPGKLYHCVGRKKPHWLQQESTAAHREHGWKDPWCFTPRPVGQIWHPPHPQSDHDCERLQPPPHTHTQSLQPPGLWEKIPEPPCSHHQKQKHQARKLNSLPPLF